MNVKRRSPNSNPGYLQRAQAIRISKHSLGKALENLARLEQLWEEATAERKRLIIGSIFPEKLIFDGKGFQTARLNEGARLIYTLNEGFSGNEKGQKTEKTALSNSVTLSGFKPETF